MIKTDGKPTIAWAPDPTTVARRTLDELYKQLRDQGWSPLGAHLEAERIVRERAAA